jgi:hypothetical protein
VWSLAFSLIAGVAALAVGFAGLVYARRLSLTSKTSPLRGDVCWLVVYAVLCFVLAVCSGALSIEPAQTAHLLRTGAALPGTPSAVFCDGFFTFATNSMAGRAPEGIQLDVLSEVLSFYALFGNTLTHVIDWDINPGCDEIDPALIPTTQLAALQREPHHTSFVMGDPKYAAKRGLVLKHIPVPAYQAAGNVPHASTIHLCRPGLYAFQDGMTDYEGANPFPVCVDARTTLLGTSDAVIVSLLAMAFAISLVSQMNSLAGKAEFVATGLAKRQSADKPADVYYPSVPPAYSHVEELPLLVIEGAKGSAAETDAA